MIPKSGQRFSEKIMLPEDAPQRRSRVGPFFAILVKS
jgi:hypothetical protein